MSPYRMLLEGEKQKPMRPKMTLHDIEGIFRLMDKKKLAYCKWCGEEIGYEDKAGIRHLNRIFHMRMKHPARKAIADLLAPLTRGDPISFPIRWERCG